MTFSGISHDENGCMSPTVYNKPLSVREFRNNTDTYCVTAQGCIPFFIRFIFSERNFFLKR